VDCLFSELELDFLPWWTQITSISFDHPGTLTKELDCDYGLDELVNEFLLIMDMIR